MGTIAIDAMGGDFAPKSVVEGVLKYVNESTSNTKIILVGKSEEINHFLPGDYPKDLIMITDAPDIFEMDEKPSHLLRRKETSLYRAAELVKNNEADAMISAGNTGGLLAAATFIVGRIKGVSRPALASPIPNVNGEVILLDCGANVEFKKDMYLSFANMGIAFSKMRGTKEPKVGLLNVGTEEEKGTEEVKAAFTNLKEKLPDNFVGFVEARDINLGNADVIVTDGWTGNIALKSMEGTAKMIMHYLKNEIKTGSFSSKLGALMLKRTFKGLKDEIDPRSHGGAFILGVNAPVVKAHGNSDSFAFKNAIKVAHRGIENELVRKIKLLVNEGENL